MYEVLASGRIGCRSNGSRTSTRLNRRLSCFWPSWYSPIPLPSAHARKPPLDTPSWLQWAFASVRSRAFRCAL